MPVRPTLVLEPRYAARALVGVVEVNKAMMRAAGPNRPRVIPLIQSRRIRYSRVDPDEHWQTYDEVMAALERDGVAYCDCEDLACLSAAEMQVDEQGPYFDPMAQPYVYKSGPRLSHVIVDSQRFGYLDPSKTAGMGWAEEELSGRRPASRRPQVQDADLVLGCHAIARHLVP